MLLLKCLVVLLKAFDCLMKRHRTILWITSNFDLASIAFVALKLDDVKQLPLSGRRQAIDQYSSILYSVYNLADVSFLLY